MKHCASSGSSACSSHGSQSVGDFASRSIATDSRASDGTRCITAFADDIAVVIGNLLLMFPILLAFFQIVGDVTGLLLNFQKIQVIYVGDSSLQQIRSLLRGLNSRFSLVQLQCEGKYLGIRLGPAAADTFWAPCRKCSTKPVRISRRCSTDTFSIGNRWDELFVWQGWKRVRKLRAIT